MAKTAREQMDFKIEYVINDELKTYYVNKDSVLIGKLAENDIELKDNTISRQHCKLERHGKTYKLIDLKSTNGSYVNGRKVAEKVLDDGDQITIGWATLKFLHVPVEENYRDIGDQHISMMVPLDELLKKEASQGINSLELNLLTALTDLGKTFISSANLEANFAKVGDIIFGAIRAERVCIFYFDDKQNDIHLKFSRHKTRHKDETVNISKTIALKAIHEKVAILSSNTRDDARFDSSKSVILYGITSAISVPIWTKDCIYGLIYVDTTSFVQVFEEKDLELMSLIANFTGLSIEGLNSLEKLTRERKLRNRLERYHSPQVVSRLIEFQDDSTGNLMAYREIEASVLFMDMVKFTTRSERMTPVEVGIFLNRYFTEMTEVIFKYNGTLDKFIGDAVMAVFGVPFELKNHAELALRAALDMRKKLQEINTGCSEEEQIRVRIGVHCGKLISGDFGSPKRLDYTVLGTTVNIASRLESSVAGTDEIAVSDAMIKSTGDLFIYEPIGEKKLHGMTKSVMTYRILGIQENK